MDNEFFAYIERLELMAFFSGYPLVYALVQVLAGSKQTPPFFTSLKRLLPYAYALTGIFFLGLLLKNMYPGYSLSNIKAQFENSWLRIWALLSLLFFIPFFAKKPVLSLLHSFVFFFFLVKDLFVRNAGPASADVVKNDMKIYTDSLIVNTGCLLLAAAIYFFIQKSRRASGR